MGVIVSFVLIEVVIDVGVDVIFVYYGYFWKGEDGCVVG